jgi:hypothetical protein
MDAIPAPVFLILALALLSLAGGLGVWLYNYLTGEGSKGLNRRRPPAVRSPAEIEGAETGAHELLSVHRTEKGELTVFVQGQHYQHLREIKDPQLGNETVEAIRLVLTFAEGWLPSMQQEPSQPSPAQPTVDQEAFLEQLRQSDLFPAETPSPGLFSQRRRRSPQPLAPLVTPADEINELVQQRVQQRSGMARQDIHITTSADGSLRFCVGLHTFTEIDQITDPAVKELIQDAIREWKER